MKATDGETVFRISAEDSGPGVGVGVGDGVSVGVGLGVGVLVAVGVAVGTEVAVGVWVGAAVALQPNSRAGTSRMSAIAMEHSLARLAQYKHRDRFCPAFM